MDQNNLLQIQFDQKSLEQLQNLPGNVILIKGHVIEDKLTITGVQYILPDPFSHKWGGGDDDKNRLGKNAFGHQWGGGDDDKK